MRFIRPPLVLTFVLALLLTACAPSAAPTAPSQQPTTAPAKPGAGKELIVFAAASLTDPFGEIATAFEAKDGAKVTHNFAGSNQLRSQLEQGAQADVFASANQTEMTNALNAGVISGDSSIFARNQLVVIVPKDNPGKVERLADLAKPGLKLVLAAPEVPVGGYALQMLDKLSADPEFGADFKSQVLKNLVSQETNVRQVVSKIQLGEGDAGVVYSTDVSPDAAAEVQVIDVPEQFNVIATYPIAVVKASTDAALAQRYVDFILSDEGQAILKKYNFMQP